jgi:rod shape determining protein RodA
MLIDRRVASHFDWVLFGLSAGLTLLGILTIYSAVYSGGEQASLASRQLYWFIFGLVAMVAAFAPDYHNLDRLIPPFYVLVLLLLVLVHGIGTEGGGSQRWLHLGFFTLQPSELSKLAMVLVMAKHFQFDEPHNGYGLKDLWVPFLWVGPLLFLILVQPDLGTAIIVFLIFLSMALIAGLRVRSLLALAAGGLALFPIGWLFLKPYQKQRIWTFLNPELDPLGSGYHVIQSKIAVGSGRLWGKGFLEGTQNRLDFLPAQHTDFIFSVFAEEWGLVGCVILLGIYFGLIFFCLRVMGRAKDRLGAMLAAGVAAMLFWQVTINTAMVTGLLPVVGITLPLFSYGGSSLVTTLIGVGLLINVSMRRFTF